MNLVLGGISSPSPIVTSLTKTILGNDIWLKRSFGASQSKYEQMACWRFLEGWFVKNKYIDHLISTDIELTNYSFQERTYILRRTVAWEQVAFGSLWWEPHDHLSQGTGIVKVNCYYPRPFLRMRPSGNLHHSFPLLILPWFNPWHGQITTEVGLLSSSLLLSNTRQAKNILNKMRGQKW